MRKFSREQPQRDGRFRNFSRDTSHSPQRFGKNHNPNVHPFKRFTRREDQNPRRTSETYEAVCDACGKNCEVPFRPTGNKPIYCSDCFRKGGHSKSGGSGLEDINRKLDLIMDALKIR